MINQTALNKFNQIYNDTYKDISKYVVLNCSKMDDIDDIIQNIYLEVFKYIKKNININKTYIMGIAKHKVKDYYRFRYKDKIISLFNKEEHMTDQIPSDFDLEKSVIEKYNVNKVWNYLKTKKVIIFKVFYLYYNLDLSIKEISNTLNISESNVKHYLYRTLKELNVFIESGCDNDA